MATANIKAVVTAEDKASPTIAKVAASTEKLGSSVRNANSAAASGSNSFGTLVSAFGIGTLVASGLEKGIGAVVSATKNMISASGDFEQYRVAFETMLGSADAARVMLQNLSNFAQKTPFTLPQVVEGAKQLLAYGIAAQDILPDFDALGNIAAGVGRDKLPFLTLAFGQVATKGKLAGQEIRQFTEAGVPLVQTLATTFGKTTAEIQALSEEGKISFEDVRKAIYSMSSEGGRFFDLMKKQSQTFGGVMSNIGDQIGRVGRQIMGISETGDIQKGGPFDKLRQGAQSFLDFLNTHGPQIAGVFQSIGAMIMGVFSVIKSVVTSVSPGFVAAGIGAIVFASALTSVVSIAGSVIAAVTAMSIATGIANIAFLALGAIAGAVLFKTISKVTNQVASQTKAQKENSTEALKAAQSTGTLAGAQDKLGSQISKVNQQIDKENRNYRESLAKMVKDAQAKVVSLKQSLDDESSSFKDVQEQAVADHEDRVQKIQDQINQETNLGSLGNARKLNDLQKELAKENAEYDKQQAKDIAKHNAKMAELQAQYDEQTNLLQKHADDVKSIQDVQLLDEIDSLKRSHAEQLASYEQQKNDIIANVGQTTSGMVGAYNAAIPQLADVGSQMGTAIGDAMIQALKDSAKEVGKSVVQFGKNTASWFKDNFSLSKTPIDNIASVPANLIKGLFNKVIGNNATGTDNWRGGPTWVGEQGPEILNVPKGSQIIPNNKINQQTPQINITVSAGAFMGSKQDARKYAMMIMDAYNTAMSAKGATT